MSAFNQDDEDWDDDPKRQRHPPPGPVDRAGKFEDNEHDAEDAGYPEAAR